MSEKNEKYEGQFAVDKQGWILSLSPGKMAILMSCAVFVAELLVMLLLDRLPTFSPLVEAMVDSCFLIAFLVPVYIFFYRPFWRVRQKAESDIRLLNNRLTAAAEEERRRIALDLHDHCDQTLVALQRTVELVQGKVIDSSEEAAALCQEIDELLGRLNNDVRLVSSTLHPPQLEEQGLAAAVQQYLDQQQHLTVGIVLELVARGESCNLDQTLAIALYRIIQEGVRNAIEHSGGELVRVHLDCDEKSVAVSIVDNGKGITGNGESSPNACPLGLIGIRERARALGGKVMLHSDPAKGTSLRVSFRL